MRRGRLRRRISCLRDGDPWPKNDVLLLDYIAALVFGVGRDFVSPAAVERHDDAMSACEAARMGVRLRAAGQD